MIASLHTPLSLSHILHTLDLPLSHISHRDVHTVCSWDEKAAQKIQRALEEEILRFTKDVQSVNTCGIHVYHEVMLLPSFSSSFSFSLFLLLLLLLLFLLYFFVHLFSFLPSPPCFPSPLLLLLLSVYYNIRKRVRCSRHIFWSGASSLLSVRTYPNHFKR